MDQLIVTLPLWYVAFLLSTTCHEAAHALVAKWGGDPTAYYEGQVSLDPTPHIRREPFGMVLIPIISFFINQGGWMIGWASAPYDPYWAMRHPKRAGAMALAGPAANFLLVLVAAAAVHIGIAAGWFSPGRLSFAGIVAAADGGKSAGSMFVSVLFSLNLLLGTLNLLPVPPLDGSGAVGLFVGDDLARRWQTAMQNRTYALMGLIVAWLVIGKVFYYVFDWSVQALYFMY